MFGRRANWKMRIAQCKRLAESAIDVAAVGTSEQEVEYLELAADFLKLAQDLEHQHAGYGDRSARDDAAADHLERLAA